MSKTPREDRLEREQPWIDWREPLPCITGRASGLACRFCIATISLKARDVAKLPQTFDEFAQHMREAHSREAIRNAKATNR